MRLFLPLGGKKVENSSYLCVVEEIMVEVVAESIAQLLGESKVEKILLAYAYKLAKAYTWRADKGVHEIAEDLLNDAVADIITGQRKWDPITTPDLLNFIMSTMRSIANRLSRHSRNSAWVNSIDTAEHGLQEDRLDYEKLIINKMSLEDFLIGVMDALEDDTESIQILSLFEQGLQRNEIIKEMNIEPSAFDAAKKRIKRKCNACISMMETVTA